MEYKTDKSPVGTARYMSVNIHNGIEASRRDDLISLGYVVIWLQIAKLPWQGIRHNNNDVRMNQVKRLKTLITSEELCKEIQGEIFSKYMNTVMSLKYDQKPDYDDMIKLFAQELRINGWFSDSLELINKKL